MKTRKPLKRGKPLRSRRKEGPSREALEHARARERAERIANQRPPMTLHRGTMNGGTSGQAVEKPQEHRNPHLLAMAKGMPCLLLVPAVCNHRQDTTVACHSNLSIHGKAGARKADDEFSVWGCSACHAWLDQGKAAAELKERVFMEALARQVQAWRGIATHTPFLKDRAAAQWALDMHAARAAGGET